MSWTRPAAPEDLIARAQDGDRRAMNELVRSHLPAVRRHVARLVPANADVDDLVQIVMCEMLRSLRAFRGEAKLETWLYQITRRVVARQRGRFIPHAETTPADAPASDDPERQAAAREGLSRVSAVLAELDDEQREAFVLFELDGFKLQEVAERMETSVPTTASRLRRARLKIFATLEEGRA